MHFWTRSGILNHCAHENLYDKKVFIALVLSKQAHTWFLNHIYLGSRQQELLSFDPVPDFGVEYISVCGIPNNVREK